MDGDACRVLRKLLDMSVDELARRAGVNPSTVSRYERGYMRARPETEAAILRALVGTEPDEAQP